MVHFVKMIAVGAVLALTGCASSGETPPSLQKTKTLQYDSMCITQGSEKVIVEGMAYNPKGWSTPTQSSLSKWKANADCSPVYDAQGNPVPYIAGMANGTDFGRDLTLSVVGMGQSYVAGALAAQEQKCSNGRCGSSGQVFINNENNNGLLLDNTTTVTTPGYGICSTGQCTGD